MLQVHFCAAQLQTEGGKQTCWIRSYSDCFGSDVADWLQTGWKHQNALEKESDLRGFKLIAIYICSHLEQSSSLAKYMPYLAGASSAALSAYVHTCVCVVRSVTVVLVLVLCCCAACGPQINALNETLSCSECALCLFTRPEWDRVEGFLREFLYLLLFRGEGGILLWVKSFREGTVTKG